MPDQQTTGQIAYDAYGENRGWKTVAGGDMPRWDDQRIVREAWEVAATAAARAALERRRKLHAYQVCDEDIVVAESWEQAVAWHAKEHDNLETDYDAEEQLVAEDQKIPYADGPHVGHTTVGAELDDIAIRGTDTPAVLASTEV